MKFRAMRTLFFLLSAVLALSCRPGDRRLTRTSDSVDFNLHIRPVLSDRCFKCHGPDANQRKAHLRLDTPEGAYAALKDNPEAHVIIPGNAEESEVYRRIASTDTAVQMPPPKSNLKLNAQEIELLRKWINQGAVYKPHWAFIPPRQKPVPGVEDEKWARNEIDRFILSRMEEEGLTPNPDADPEHLLKRVCMDITGLPPSIEMQDQFSKDPSAEAYEKIVDQLLADPHFGEKMAAHWMDVARYADSHGYQDDGLRTMWPWRDWVIHAFNKNYPYDQFVTWQLAGDLLPDPTREQLLATGFNRNHKITQEGGVIQEEYRVEYVTDRTNTFGKAFLALTFECAHCHDHKYDPISQKAYYGTFAFFNQVPEKGLVGDISLASLADPPKIRISSQEIADILTFINKKDTASVEVMIMQDSIKRRPTYILKRGVYDAHGDPVNFDLPSAILPFDSVKYGNNRLGLARWLFDPKHPLTARVFVNRMWQVFLGRGLVKSSGDFGMQGDMPTHQELLDWLAVDFREHGWDVKRLIKQIVSSSTYRQSSATTPDKQKTDPDNLYLSHGPRIRYSAEASRDMVLVSSGLLNPEIGGPSSKIYQPPGIWEQSTSGRGVLAHYRQDHGDKLYRRGLYTFIKRTVPPPSLLVFDASNRDQCEVKRQRTNTPLQALLMLNDPVVLEASRVLAEKLMASEQNTEARLEKAFRLILCRKPSGKEKEILQTAWKDAFDSYTKDPDRAKQFIKQGEYPFAGITDAVELAALMQTVHMIYNLEESITRT